MSLGIYKKSVMMPVWQTAVLGSSMSLVLSISISFKAVMNRQFLQNTSIVLVSVGFSEQALERSPL